MMAPLAHAHSEEFVTFFPGADECVVLPSCEW